nr:hypothetical protein GCM10017606_25180 [Microbacterium terregens]
MLLVMLREPMLLLLLLAGCGSPPTPQQCAKLMTDQAIIERCGSGSMHGVWKDAEDCYPLAKPERITGLVIRDFERSELFVGASRLTPEMRRYTEGTWLEWSKKTRDEAPHAIESGAYLIAFEGRRSACPKPAGKLNGYGHMGNYRELAIVDHLISWKQVARLPSPFRSTQ